MQKEQYLFCADGASVALCSTANGNRFLRVRGCIRPDVVLGILRALCPGGNLRDFREGRTC